MGRKKLPDDVLKTRANLIYKVLKDNRERYVLSCELKEKTGLTTGQISSAIRFTRQQSLVDYERFINYYIVSGRKGYKLPDGIEDYAKCYASLRRWASSIIKTIQPMREVLSENGYDPDRILALSDSDNTLETTPEGSWGNVVVDMYSGDEYLEDDIYDS